LRQTKIWNIHLSQIIAFDGTLNYLTSHVEQCITQTRRRYERFHLNAERSDGG